VVSAAVFLFEIRSSLAELDPLWREVRAELEAGLFGLTEPTLRDLRWVLTEAVTNAIVHGHGEDGRSMTVEIRCQRGRLEVRVHDSGPGFRVADLHDPPRPEFESGRGLWMMQELVDELEFQRSADHNTLRLALGFRDRTRDLS
jgi:stage II sporulation protein AB (anti-sigma F factor)